MTVSYSAEVSTSSFSCFLKLLLRWRASIYKLVWMDLITFLGLYYTFSLSYRFAMNEDQRRLFEGIVYYCNSEGTLIPVSFVLGFYVSVVMKRWWHQYLSLPWPDSLAVNVSTLIHGQDDRGRVMRRTIMRYVCLCSTIVLSMISPRVKKRFPTIDHFVDAGLLLENEKAIMKDLDESLVLLQHSRHWMPIVWAASIVTRARKEGRIRDDVSLKTIMDELDKFRMKNFTLLLYDTVCIPLVYTQVVTLAVYTYFLSTVVGMQWLDKTDPDGYTNVVDYYIPIFTTLEFFFYMGWLKVAEQLINPFGEDDDDFEFYRRLHSLDPIKVNWLIDRNLQVSYLIVDEMHNDHPQLVKDQYWEQVFPSELPYPIDEQNIPEAPQADTPSSALQYLWKRTSGTAAPFQRSLLRIKGSMKKIMTRDKSTLSDSDDSEIFVGKKHEVIKYSDELPKNVSAHKSEIETTEPLSSGETLKSSDTDHFEQLKEERGRENIVRQQQKLMQNVNTVANVTAEMPPEQQANILPLVTAVTALNQISDTPPDTDTVQRETSHTSLESAHDRNLNEQ